MNKVIYIQERGLFKFYFLYNIVEELYLKEQIKKINTAR